MMMLRDPETATAASGQTRPWRHVGVESVLPPTSDIGRRRRHGSSVPIVLQKYFEHFVAQH
jgi:hypothetical protein